MDIKKKNYYLCFADNIINNKMPTTNFDKRKDDLINAIREGVTEEAELIKLQTQLDKLMARKAAKLKKVKKEKVDIYPATQRVPIATSIQSESYVNHTEAIEELKKMILEWK